MTVDVIDVTVIHLADFNLSGGCFGTEIIQNCTNWSNIGVHCLRLGPIEAEFQGASFLVQKNAGKWSKKHKNVVFGENHFWEAKCLTPKMEKKCSDTFYSKLINLIIYNQI